MGKNIFYTKEDIKLGKIIYKSFYSEVLKDESLKVCVNPEKDDCGNVVSVYYGIEKNGQALTDFDNYLIERSV